MSKASVRCKAAKRDHLQMLDFWFWYSGDTMKNFIARVERTGSGYPNPWINVDVFHDVRESDLHPDWKIAIMLSMQHVACTKS